MFRLSTGTADPLSISSKVWTSPRTSTDASKLRQNVFSTSPSKSSSAFSPFASSFFVFFVHSNKEKKARKIRKNGGKKQSEKRKNVKSLISAISHKFGPKRSSRTKPKQKSEKKKSAKTGEISAKSEKSGFWPRRCLKNARGRLRSNRTLL